MLHHDMVAMDFLQPQILTIFKKKEVLFKFVEKSDCGRVKS